MALMRPRAGQVNFDVTDITDPLIRINSGQSGANDKDIGIVFERGSDTNVAVIWDESADKLAVINTTETGTTSGDVAISSYANLQIGALTVSGNILPTANTTYDIGSSSLRFNDIYLAGNTIDLGGTKISKDSNGDIDLLDGSNNKKTIKVSSIELFDSSGKSMKIERDATTGKMKSRRFKSDGTAETDSDDVLEIKDDKSPQLGNNLDVGTYNIYSSNGTVQFADHVHIGLNQYLMFEGSSTDAYQTILTVTNPTADRTFTLPNKSGTVAVTDDIPTKISSFSNDSSYATQTYVNTAVSNLVDSAPGTLNTLNELAAALGDDANFSTTITNSIATKLPLAGGTMTGAITFAAGQTFDGRDVSADGTKLDSIASNATAYSNSDVDSHLNQSNPTSGYVLSWNGTDYAWVAPGGGIALTDLSVTTNSAGSAALSYNNTTGVFSYTPPDLSSYITGYTVTESDVTTHQAALSITESQISDLGSYITGNQTITLSGDVSGSGTTSIVVTVADDSHNHIISNVDGLQTALDGKSSTSHNHTLDSLSNTTITSVADGELLVWDTSTSKWINNTLAEAGIYSTSNPAGYTTNVGTVTSVSGTGTVSGLTLTGSVTTSGSLTLGGAITGFATTSHNHTLDGLSNTTITSNSAGEILKWNGTAWVNNTLAEAGIYSTSNPSGYTTNTGTVTSVETGTGLTGGTITTSGTVSLATAGAGAATYSSGISSITVDAYGRVTSVTGSSGYTTNVGDITQVNITAGTGLSGSVNTTSGAHTQTLSIDSTVATLTGSQTLTNKTLTLPTIGGTGASFSGSTSGTTTVKAAAAAGTTTITMPATTGTMALTSDIPTNNNQLTNGAGYITSASPGLTGTPTAPTAAAGTNTTQIATTAFVGTAVSNLVDSAPGTLNTLNELAAALGDDANFSTTVTNSIATKLPLAGGQMTGNITFSGAQTVDGRDLSVDGAKLDGIESGATADQTASEILTAIKTVDGSGSGLDADLLDGVQGSSYLRSDANDTHSGTLTFSTTGTAIALNNGNITGVNSLSINDPGEGIIFTGTNNVILYAIDDANDNIMNFSGAAELRRDNNKVWDAGNDGSGSGLDADLLDGQHGSYYLPASSYTAADVLTKTKTVDGSGSGLDADLLDGNHSSAFATAAQGTTADNALPKSGGTMTGNINFNSTQSFQAAEDWARDNSFKAIGSGFGTGGQYVKVFDRTFNANDTMSFVIQFNERRYSTGAHTNPNFGELYFDGYSTGANGYIAFNASYHPHDYESTHITNTDIYITRTTTTNRLQIYFRLTYSDSRFFGKLVNLAADTTGTTYDLVTCEMLYNETPGGTTNLGQAYNPEYRDLYAEDYYGSANRTTYTYSNYVIPASYIRLNDNIELYLGTSSTSDITHVFTGTDYIINSGSGHTSKLIKYNTGVYNSGTTTITLDVANGNITASEFQGTATSAKYADLAEKYTTGDTDLLPGTAVAVGLDDFCEVVPAKSSDICIGVVSTEPALMMNSDGDGQYIGLKGRLPVRVSGPVKKGQAIYAWDNGVCSTIATSALVGVALESNNSQEEKLVECVLKV